MSHTIATPNGMGEETIRDHVEMQNNVTPTMQ